MRHRVVRLLVGGIQVNAEGIRSVRRRADDLCEFHDASFEVRVLLRKARKGTRRN